MKLKVYIHSSWSQYSKEHTFTIYNSDMTDYGYHLVEIREIDYTPPSAQDLCAGTVAALKQKIQKIHAEAYRATSEIQEEIHSLLALEAPQ